MYAQAEKPKENKSRTVANSVAQKKSSVKQGFGFVDNRPEAITQRKLKEMASVPIQMAKGKKTRKKKNEDTLTVWKPEHSQEDIQDVIIALWLKSPKDDLDLLRAQYASKYSGEEGGWCDGWSHVLSRGGDKLVDIWKEIDDAISNQSEVTMSIAYDAVELARSASLYHIINNDPPDPTSQKRTDFEDAHYDLETKPETRESWRHDFEVPLKLYVIKDEIKFLDNGETLRLTSPTHDAAVKRYRNGYLVSETEKHGVQQGAKLEEVMIILSNWQKECEESGALFFTQTMVV